MTDRVPRHDILEGLGAFGADLGRWPAERAAVARAALLSDRETRAAWEAERELDRLLAAHRDLLDGEIARSGAADRISDRILERLASARAHRLPWRQMAAAMLVAAMLGSAADLMLAEAERADPAAIDPLFTLEDPALG